jgi:hypothetical protein
VQDVPAALNPFAVVATIRRPNGPRLTSPFLPAPRPNPEHEKEQESEHEAYGDDSAPSGRNGRGKAGENHHKKGGHR